MMNSPEPRIVVFSTLFPHPGQPGAGLFIRERMFRVAAHLPLTVVSPQPWFPFQSLIRRVRPSFRPAAPQWEVQHGIEVYYPRVFSVPGLFKFLDGFFMALGSWWSIRKLKRGQGVDIIDAHFAFPDGYAAGLLANWLNCRLTITLRGTEVPHSRHRLHRRRILKALRRADGVFAVADSLKRHVVALGAPADKIEVVGNGVDVDKFKPLPREEARARLGLDEDTKVLVSVGGLTERKGFHRVLEVLPSLKEKYPDLKYLIIGGASAEGDWRTRLVAMSQELGLEDNVVFLGALPADELKRPLSAADVFVLATRNEGWANVFLEAMACGVPVVTTDVGGNREVVQRDALGSVVEFGDRQALQDALDEALAKDWDRTAIRRHAEANSWDNRIAMLVPAFRQIAFDTGNEATVRG